MGTGRVAVSGLQGMSDSKGEPSGRNSRQLRVGLQAAKASTAHAITQMGQREETDKGKAPEIDVTVRCGRPASGKVADNGGMNALDGIRILDLSRVLAGPWCTQTLADLGADVVKVERPASGGHPGGDDTRGWGPPFLRGRDGEDTAEAAYYLGANRNKRSITCDIAQPEGQALIRELALKADVFVENYKVGDMARYGLDFASLHAINPKLVYCSITGFGQTGPYKDRAGYDYAIQGMGGLMSITGERDDLPGGGPQKVGVAVADLFTGLYATVAIQAALRHAERTGEGQHIDMALLDTQVAMLANLGANYLVRGKEEGKVPGRAGNAHANIVPYQVFEVAPDATGKAQHLILAVGNDGQFAKFCGVAGRPELATDERFARNQNRVRHREALVPILETIMKSRGKVEWLASLEAAKVPCGAINNMAEVFADPQVLHREMVHTWSHPLTDAVDLVASPMKLSATPVRTDLPPPTLGEHSAQVLNDWLGSGAERLSELRRRGIV
jgi:crotonobetainyl-CoA:carnitine CoA-transferase CaiB-like acyl-CoA transferase